MDSNDKCVISQNSVITKLSQVRNNNKRSRSDQDSNHTEVRNTMPTNSKKRSTDLICVICQAPAFGYNFDQISCSSCKEFFRRTALLPIEKTKCMNKKNRSINIRCEIRFNMKQKCQRCRLLKCFELDMRTDHLMTPEEKLSKQQRIEENRRIGSVQIIHKNSHQTAVVDTRCETTKILTDNDRTCLSYLEAVYLSAVRSSPSASSVLSFELSFNKTFSLMDMIEIEKFTAIKLINFLRLIPEFQSLDEEDRLALVKYNLILLILLRDALTYDSETDLFCDDIRSPSVSLRDKIFAENYKSLGILFYGYEYVLLYTSHIRSIINIADNDPLLIKLLMLVLIFLKGISPNEERIWVLSNPQSVFNAHSKYVDLLFRYLIDRYSFDVAGIKMMQIIQFIFNTQKHAQIYQEKIQKESTIIEIHPLMKSLLGLT